MLDCKYDIDVVQHAVRAMVKFMAERTARMLQMKSASHEGGREDEISECADRVNRLDRHITELTNLVQAYECEIISFQ